MKQFILNYKLQVFAVGVLALAQVSSFSADSKPIERYVAQELGDSSITGAIVSTEVSTDVRPSQQGREDQIFDAYKRYQEKSKECLVKVRDDDSMKSAFRDYRLDSSDENLEALAGKLEDMGLLSANSSSSSGNTSFRDRLLSLESSSSSSESSSSAILDADNKSDLKEIARCHERRIQDLDSAEEKRAYFKKIEHKFADMLAESDSKEVSELAKEFLKTAKTADPNNALGLQTVAQMHAEYAMAMANGVAQIRLLEQQLAANPNDQLLHSRLQLAKTTLDNQFSGIQTRFMSTINPQSSNALEQMTAIQTVSTNWNQQKTSALGGQSLTSFGNMVNANGLTGDPLINGGLGLGTGLNTGVSTLPSIGASNMLTIPQINTVPNGNLMTGVRGDSRLNIPNIDPSFFANPANRIQNTARQVPALGMPQ